MALTKRKLLISLPILVVGLICIFATVKKVSPLSLFLWGNQNLEKNVAAHQYDLVSYLDNKPKLGLKEYRVNHEGVEYYFSNTENQATFLLLPDKYIPEFGGFCAFAVSKGFTADTNPEAWVIVNDKLYLFADKNVEKDWLESIDTESIAMSHTNWQAAQ
ncbi:MAG: hypothetical protein MJK12_00900 [Colwellia sp.]|nr:hypothetical protein [Colwellia sp.]